MSEDRLTRMGDKIDKLSEATLAIARMEERMLTVFKWLENVDGSIKKMDDRIDEMEKQALARGQKIAFAECLAPYIRPLIFGFSNMVSGAGGRMFKA